MSSSTSRKSSKAPGMIDVRWVARVGTGRKAGQVTFVLAVRML